MKQTPLTQSLETPPLNGDNTPAQLSELLRALEKAGLVDAETPGDIRQKREAGPYVFNPLDGFAPMVNSVPRADR